MMKQPVIDEVMARRFLLGQLSPEEQGQIEELAFEDPDAFTLIESVGEDLIDEFLHNELSPLEKQGFEDHFMSLPGRRQDVEVSEALNEHVNAAPEPAPTPAERNKVETVDDDWKFLVVRFIDSLKASSYRVRAIAVVVVALLIIALWLISQDEKEPDPLQAGPGTPVHVSSPEPQISPSPSPSPVHVALLMPSAKPRGAPGQPLHLPPDASSVSVGLALTDPKIYRTYDATLVNEAGIELYRWSDLEEQRLAAQGGFPETRGLLIPVKTALLKPDENYRIEITGLSPKGERSTLEGYSFQAKK